jgi:hypothetical protein
MGHMEIVDGDIMDLKDTTKMEVMRMKERGMQQLTKEELLTQLKQIGYKPLKALTFNDNNLSTFNPYPYKMKGLYIVESDTGISAFHYKDARRDDNFNKLQDIRMNTFVFENGRIWSY